MVPKSIEATWHGSFTEKGPLACQAVSCRLGEPVRPDLADLRGHNSVLVLTYQAGAVALAPATPGRVHISLSTRNKSVTGA